MQEVAEYTQGEEIANAVTHGVGAAFSVAALAVLVTFAGLYGDPWRVVSFSIYGSTLILLYLASTFYHSFSNKRVKRIFRHFDHSAIFLLIAGTYTPLTLVNLRGGFGWTLFGLVWGIAIFGVLISLIFPMGRFRVLKMVLYLSMGWLIVFAVKPLFAAVSPGGLMWIGIGGLAYTFGVVFYLWNKLPFNHAIWHLFVLGGSVCHFFGILFHVLPVGK
ncbi:hemolysin III family protein [Bdellovibrionota bacterium]